MQIDNRKYICVYGAPRTGSNLLNHLLLSNNLSYGLFEIFHHKIIMTQHQDLILSQYQDFENYRMRCNDDPLMVLDQLFKNIPNPILIYKLFPEHLSDRAMEKVASKCSVAVLLKRNLLNSYASDKIAIETNFYEGYQRRNDNDQLQVEWDISKFVDWSVHVLKFMCLSEQQLAKYSVPILDITYDEVVSMQTEPEKIWDQLATVCCRKFETYFDGVFTPEIHKQNAGFVLDCFIDPSRVEFDLYTHGLDFLISNSDKYSSKKLLDLISDIQYKHGYFA